MSSFHSYTLTQSLQPLLNLDYQVQTDNFYIWISSFDTRLWIWPLYSISYWTFFTWISHEYFKTHILVQNEIYSPKDSLSQMLLLTMPKIWNSSVAPSSLTSNHQFLPIPSPKSYSKSVYSSPPQHDSCPHHTRTQCIQDQNNLSLKEIPEKSVANWFPGMQTSPLPVHFFLILISE